MKAAATGGEHKSLPGLKCVTVIINMVCENCEGNSGKLLSSAEHISRGGWPSKIHHQRLIVTPSTE